MLRKGETACALGWQVQSLQWKWRPEAWTKHDIGGTGQGIWIIERSSIELLFAIYETAMARLKGETSECIWAMPVGNVKDGK